MSGNPIKTLSSTQFIRILSFIISGPAVILIAGVLISRFSRTNFNWILFVVCIALWTASAALIYRKYFNFVRSLWFVLPVYLTFSILFLTTPYLLSDDIERYVWEGYVQNLGFSPYVVSPDDPRFSDETLNQKVNHPHMTAIYPPLSQLIFRILAWINPSQILFKSFFFLISLVFIFFLWYWRCYFNSAYILAGIFPFLAIETSWSGHLDVLAVFFLAVSFLQVLKKHYFFSGIFLGLSAMSKLVPLLLSIFFMKEILLQYQWRIQKPEKQTFLSVGVFGIGLILPFFLYIPHLWAEGYLISSLAVYSRQWVFGSFFYSLLGLTGMDGFWIRIISGLNLFFAAAIIILRRRDLKTNLFFFMISLSLFSPVVHPWYLLWLIPFAGEKYFYTAVVFLLASYLSYEVLEGMFANHVWQEKPLIIIAGYAAALFVLVFETYGKNIRRLLAGSQDDPAT